MLFALGIFVFIFSCSNTPTPPIAADKMKNILLDLQTAEAYSAIVPKEEGEEGPNKKNKDTLSHYYALVLKRYDISQQEFEQAMDWYFKHPAQADTLFNYIIDTSNAFKTKFALPESLKMDSVVLDTLTIPEVIDSVNIKGPKRFTRPARPPGLSNNETSVMSQNPVDTKEQEAIKKESKAKKEALEKVKQSK